MLICPGLSPGYFLPIFAVMESVFKIPVQLRWSDFDANFHLRHSAYYDFGAMARITLLESVGLTESVFKEHAFGPVIFREECTFRKEIQLNDKLEITCELLQCKPNGARFAFRHRLFKNTDVFAAEINISGDWLDLKTRKLLHPPAFLGEMMERMPRSEEFKFV